LADDSACFWRVIKEALERAKEFDFACDHLVEVYKTRGLSAKAANVKARHVMSEYTPRCDENMEAGVMRAAEGFDRQQERRSHFAQRAGGSLVSSWLPDNFFKVRFKVADGEKSVVRRARIREADDDLLVFCRCGKRCCAKCAWKMCLYCCNSPSCEHHREDCDGDADIAKMVFVDVGKRKRVKERECKRRGCVKMASLACVSAMCQLCCQDRRCARHRLGASTFHRMMRERKTNK
jgi:hypothetical protein